MSDLYARYKDRLRAGIVEAALLDHVDRVNLAVTTEVQLFPIWSHSILSLMPSHEKRRFGKLTVEEQKKYFKTVSPLSFDRFLSDFRRAALVSHHYKERH